MKTGALAALAALILSTLTPGTAPAQEAAQERLILGWGRLFVNDALGDTRDRWRTGSYTVSLLTGRDWSGTLPDRPGELLEWRFHGEIIAPNSLSARPGTGDRRYAGILSLGLHTHFDWGGMETSLGADLVGTGPSTGVARFQRRVHEWLDMPKIRAHRDQIGDGIHPTLKGEVGRAFALGDSVTLRPFAAAEAGAETLVRAGGDITFGGFGTGALMLRDSTTGQRYRGLESDHIEGFSLMLGADVARVFDSIYLPSGGDVTLSDTRSRVRAGVHWQGGASSVFYGLTWLGREFEEQKEGQLVGALNLNISF